MYAVRFNKNSRFLAVVTFKRAAERLHVVRHLMIVMKILQSIPKSLKFVTKEIFRFKFRNK